MRYGSRTPPRFAKSYCSPFAIDRGRQKVDREVMQLWVIHGIFKQITGRFGKLAPRLDQQRGRCFDLIRSQFLPILLADLELRRGQRVDRHADVTTGSREPDSLAAAKGEIEVAQDLILTARKRAYVEKCHSAQIPPQ